MVFFLLLDLVTQMSSNWFDKKTHFTCYPEKNTGSYQLADGMLINLMEVLKHIGEYSRLLALTDGMLYIYLGPLFATVARIHHILEYNELLHQTDG